MTEITFPKDFLWGTATSAYQIEGATNQDGRGKSIWDVFCEEPGNIKDEDDGSKACDHYNLYREDVKLMDDLGIEAYRFSISWPRVIPEGTGEVNEEGLDFYDRLIDSLLEAEITPYITLYHWDLPYSIQEKGGWTNRDSINWFTDYVSAVISRLGDRVKHWLTINEPWVASYVGHEEGRHAPGKQNFKIANQVAHNLLVAHGKAVKSIRSKGDSNHKVGLALNVSPGYPLSDCKLDQEAASRFEKWHNDSFLKPIFQGKYPEKIIQLYEENGIGPEIKKKDLEIINQELDYLGINYYTRRVIRHDKEHPLGFRQLSFDDCNLTERKDFSVAQQCSENGFYDILTKIWRSYQLPPIYITENGAAMELEDEAKGSFNDTERVAYLREHLRQIRQAMVEGVEIKGYFIWSLLDNFEWEKGYSRRFGIVHVDFDTKERIAKQSAKWFRSVIENNGFDVEIDS